jgi:hypothetical protein
LQKIPKSTPEASVGRKKILCKTNNFGLKTQNSGFQKHEVSGRKNEVSVRKTRSFGSKTLKFRFENPEVLGKTIELETSVKVVFQNTSVEETQYF